MEKKYPKNHSDWETPEVKVTVESYAAPDFGESAKPLMALAYAPPEFMGRREDDDDV